MRINVSYATIGTVEGVRVNVVNEPPMGPGPAFSSLLHIPVSLLGKLSYVPIFSHC